MAGIAIDHWSDLDGYAVSLRLPDLRTLPISRFCNFIWWWATRNARDQAAVDKMKATLWRPPPSRSKQRIDPRSPWSAEAEAAGFAALRAGLGGKPQGSPQGPPMPDSPGREPAQGRRVPIKRRR